MENIKNITANDIKMGEILMLTTRLTQITDEAHNIIKIISADNMKLKPETTKILNIRLRELLDETDYIDRRIERLKNEELQNIEIKVNLTDVTEDFKWEIYDLFNKLHTNNPDNFNYSTMIDENRYSKDYVNE